MMLHRLMNRLHSSGGVPGWRFLSFVLLFGALLSWSAIAAPMAAAAPLYPCENERIGYGVVTGIQNFDVTPLNAGWYVNWGWTPQAVHPGGLDYYQVVDTWDSGYAPSGASLDYLVGLNPGSVWLVGNEPDSPYQNNVPPTVYAQIYHDAYYRIKNRDPWAQVAIGGMIQATPLRMKWLNAVWNAYQSLYGQPMPVDVWNVHAFVLREVRSGFENQCGMDGAWGAFIPPGLPDNCGQNTSVDDLDRLDLLGRDIRLFRTWMRDHGQQNKPLIVSEYGILFPDWLGYDYARVRDYMLASFDYFRGAVDLTLGYPSDDYRLVQRWAWYSLDDDNFENSGTTYGALMNPRTFAMNAIGYEFANYSANLASQCSPYVDLRPLSLRAIMPAPVVFGQPGVVHLELIVRNQGTLASSAAQVQFWDGPPGGGGALLGTVPLGPVPPRYQGDVTVVLDPSMMAHSAHNVTAIVDAFGQVAEYHEDNNQISMQVDFGSVNLTAGPASWQLVRGPLRAGEATPINLPAVPVTVTQTSGSSPGVNVTPPSFRATWYDDDPAMGGQIITSQMLPGPVSFGGVRPVPQQVWNPVMIAARTPTLVVSLDGGVPETSTADNTASVLISAATDLVITGAELVGGPPLPDPSGRADLVFRFRLANLGTRAPGSPVVVALRPRPAPGGQEIDRAGLAPVGDWTDVLTWPNVLVGGYAYLAEADPDQTVQETNEANNTFSGLALVAGAKFYMPLGRR